MVLQLLTQTVAIGAKVKEIHDQMNTLFTRGIVVTIANATSEMLKLTHQEHTSGAFEVPPDNNIPPAHASTFGSKGSLGFGFASKGKVRYSGTTLNFDYIINWEVPIIGDNYCIGTKEGGARRYIEAAGSTGAFAVPSSKHDLWFAPTQDQWRRCGRCGTLNLQAGGLDGACVGGGTHDNSVSGNYFVLSQGFPSLDPWVGKHCGRCDCMVHGEALIPGSCAAGGNHDQSQPGWYALVADAGSPGETGWRLCGLCNGIVIDPSRPCPSGGWPHAVLPAPVFNMWRI